jgi:hypothetical protein
MLAADRAHPVEEIVGHCNVEAEEFLHLRQQDEQRDAVGETNDDRDRNEPDQAPIRVTPIARRSTPAAIVQTIRLATPYCATMPYTMTMLRTRRTADLNA